MLKNVDSILIPKSGEFSPDTESLSHKAAKTVRCFQELETEILHVRTMGPYKSSFGPFFLFEFLTVGGGAQGGKFPENPRTPEKRWRVKEKNPSIESFVMTHRAKVWGVIPEGGVKSGGVVYVER